MVDQRKRRILLIAASFICCIGAAYLAGNILEASAAPLPDPEIWHAHVPPVWDDIVIDATHGWTNFRGYDGDDSANYAYLGATEGNQIVIDFGGALTSGSDLHYIATIYGEQLETFASDDDETWTSKGISSPAGGVPVWVDAGVIGAHRYMRWVCRSGSNCAMSQAYVTLAEIPYTTPTAVPATATPASWLMMPCLPVTATATYTLSVRTPTPYGRTATPPGATITPGGPTLTPMPTGTPNPSASSYDSGVFHFDTDVAPLEASGQVNSAGSHKFLEWSNTIGYDGNPGAAYFDGGGASNVLTLSVSSLAYGFNAVTWHKTGGFGSGPVAVSFYAKTSYQQMAGDRHMLRIWYLDPHYDSAGPAWVTFWSPTHGDPAYVFGVDGLELSSNWNHIGYLITPVGGSGHIDAIGITNEAYSELSYPYVYNPTFGVYLDDLRVTYGDANYTHFEICGPGGGGLSPGTGEWGPGGPNRPGQVCIVTISTIDVTTSACTQPAEWTDIGGWISWVWCRITAYFTWIKQNNDQLSAMVNSQIGIEPFGSITEMGGVVGTISNELDMLQQANHNNGVAPYDFANLMDMSALDQKPDLHVVTSTSYDYLAQCPSEIISQDSTAMRSACMSIYLLRTTPAVQIIQWILNGAFVIMLIYVTINIIKSLAKT